MTHDFPPSPPTSPLPYAPPQRGRPGLITTVGVLSIIFGALSVLGCLSEIGSGVGMMFMSNVAMPAPLAAPATSARGAVVGWSVSLNGTAGSTTAPTTTRAAAATPTTPAARIPPLRFHVDRGASILTIAEAAISIPVAVLLLIGGILIFRDSPAARPLHRWYVILKLPLIAVAAIATWWTYSGLMSSMTGLVAPGPGMPGGFVNAMAAVQVIFRAALSLAYPIFLIVVFLTRTWRDYFAAISHAGFAA